LGRLILIGETTIATGWACAGTEEGCAVRLSVP